MLPTKVLLRSNDREHFRGLLLLRNLHRTTTLPQDSVSLLL